MNEANLSVTLASIMMLDNLQLDNLFIYLQELAIALQNMNPIFKDALDMNLRNFLAPFDNRQIDGMLSYYESIGLNLNLIKTHQIMYGGVPNELVPLTQMPEINITAIEALYEQINLNSNSELSFIGIGLKEYARVPEELRSQILHKMTTGALTVAICDWKAKKLTFQLIDDTQFTNGVSKQQMIKVVDANIEFLNDLKQTAIELKERARQEEKETLERNIVSRTMQVKESELEIKSKGLDTDKKSMSHAIKFGATGGITVGILLFLALQQLMYSSGVVAFQGAMGVIDMGQIIGMAAQSTIKSWTGIDLDILKSLPVVADEMNKLLATNKETYIQSLNQLKAVFEKEQSDLEKKYNDWKSDIELKQPKTKALADEEMQLRTYIEDVAQLKNNINFLERRIDQATQDTKNLDQIKKLQNESSQSDAWSKLTPELLPECLASDLMPNTCDVTSSLMNESASKPTMSSQVYLAKLLQHRDKLMRQRGNINATLKSLPAAPMFFGEDQHRPVRQKNNIMLNGLKTQIDILNTEIESLSKSVKDEINVLETEKKTMMENRPRIPVKISLPPKSLDADVAEAKVLMAAVKKDKEQQTKEVEDALNKLAHFEKFETMMENIGTNTNKLANASEDYAKISKEYREASAKQSTLGKMYEYGMEKIGRTTPFAVLEQSKESSESNYYQQSVEYLTNMSDIYKIASESINANDTTQIPFFAKKTAQNITDNIQLMNSLTYSIDETGPDLSPATARLIAQHRQDQARYSEGIKSQLADPRTKYYETLNAATTAVDSIAVVASTLVGAITCVMMVKALRQSSSTKSGGNKKTRKHKRKMTKTVRKNKIKRIKSHKQKHNKTRK
jgi:hypothetical protein